MVTFVPPDARQLVWMVTHDATRSYLGFVTHVHDLLCLYSPQPIFPHAWRPGEEQGEFERRMRELVGDFRLTSSASKPDESIVRDIGENRSRTLNLHERLINKPQVDPEVEIFLRTVVDAYTFVAMGTKPRP